MPAKTRVLFMWYLIGFCLCVVVALLTAGLLVQRAKRRHAEDGLQASQNEQRRLTGRLIEAQERERQRIARELKDRLGGISTRVKELSSAVHALSHLLHPSKLEQVGLTVAVRGLCEEFTRSHSLQVTFTYAGMPIEIPNAMALCLYRIAQEALRNVVRHSGTNRAAVELTGTSVGIRLRVSDGGEGFDPGSARCLGGLGLVSMRERLHLVGGELMIASRPMHGTRIDARVPVPSPDHLEGAQRR
jgi:signal transduction histidine kinase